MGDHDETHAVPGLQRHDEVQDLLLDRHVESRGRFVGNQELRVAGDGDGDHHPLALPARHLVREAAQPLFRVRQAHLLEEFDGAGAAGLSVEAEVDA